MTDDPASGEPASDPRLLLLAPGDSVFVLRAPVDAGEVIRVAGRPAVVARRLGLGHKIARIALAAGQPVIKYGAPIGRATIDIRAGDHVHLHNLASGYTPTYALEAGS
jgi:hypothetical protein